MRAIPDIFLRAAVISGFVVVVFGAFGAHALKGLVAESALGTWQTAVQYHMFHTLALFMLGLLVRQNQMSTVLFYCGIFFVAGIVLFSGSLYVLTLTQASWLGGVTPLGGVCFLLGWSMLFKAVVSFKE